MHEDTSAKIWTHGQLLVFFADCLQDLSLCPGNVKDLQKGGCFVSLWEVFFCRLRNKKSNPFFWFTDIYIFIVFQCQRVLTLDLSQRVSCQNTRSITRVRLRTKSCKARKACGVPGECDGYLTSQSQGTPTAAWTDTRWVNRQPVASKKYVKNAREEHGVNSDVFDFFWVLFFLTMGLLLQRSINHQYWCFLGLQGENFRRPSVFLSEWWGRHTKPVSEKKVLTP